MLVDIDIIMRFFLKIHLQTDRIDAVINCIRIRVNIKAKLTNLMKISRIEDIMVNKGRIHREIKDF